MSFLNKVVEQVAVQTVAKVVHGYTETGIQKVRRVWENHRLTIKRKKRDHLDEDLSKIIDTDATSVLKEMKKKDKK